MDEQKIKDCVWGQQNLPSPEFEIYISSGTKITCCDGCCSEGITIGSLWRNGEKLFEDEIEGSANSGAMFQNMISTAKFWNIDIREDNTAVFISEDDSFMVSDLLETRIYFE